MLLYNYIVVPVWSFRKATTAKTCLLSLLILPRVKSLRCSYWIFRQMDRLRSNLVVILGSSGFEPVTSSINKRDPDH